MKNEKKKPVVKVEIDAERCKGCGLCVLFCRRGCLRISEKSNARGNFPVEHTGGECSGCLACAFICPDLVFRITSNSEGRPKTAKTARKAAAKKNA